MIARLQRGRRAPSRAEVAWATETHDFFLNTARRVYERDGYARALAFVLVRVPMPRKFPQSNEMHTVPRRDAWDSEQWAAEVRREVQEMRGELVVLVTEAWRPPKDLPPEAALALKMRGVPLEDLPGAVDTLLVSAETRWGSRLHLCELHDGAVVDCADSGWGESGVVGGILSGFFA